MRSEDLTLAVNRDMPLDMPPDHSAPDIADRPPPPGVYLAAHYLMMSKAQL